MSKPETTPPTLDGDVPVGDTLEDLMTLAKQYRQLWADTAPGEAMPAMVVGYRGGRAQAVVLCPQPNRDIGLRTCEMLRTGMGVDALALVTDAYCLASKPVTTGNFKEDEKAAKEMMDKALGPYKTMQDAVQAGKRGDISDTLVITKLSKDGLAEMAGALYTASDKPGPVAWGEDRFMASDTAAEERVGGRIIDAMRHILASPFILDVDGDHIGAKLGQVGGALGMSREQMEWHGGNAIIKILKAMDSIVYDMRVPPPDAGEAKHTILDEDSPGFPHVPAENGEEKENYVRIRFGPGETGWGVMLPDGTCRVNNIPASTGGLNIDDVVRLDPPGPDGRPGAGELVSRGYKWKFVFEYRSIEQFKAISAAVKESGGKMEGLFGPNPDIGKMGLAAAAFNDPFDFDDTASRLGLHGMAVIDREEMEDVGEESDTDTE